MAIIQISKIQQRSGNLVDLPQLDEAQFGWATDAKRLFIGKTSPNENIEVLTSYSNISFSQIDGSDGGNFNIANSTNGQVLTYVATTNTWENWPSSDILTANANFKLNLGDAGNIRISGGATGYVLETDGAGNLAWTSKGSIRTNIIALSNATPVVMQVANTTPLTNGTSITISGAVAANANTIVNGQSFYVQVANDFATTGNVSLYNAANLAPGNAVVGTNLGTYTANSGVMTSAIGTSGSSNAGGSANTIQFNNGGILDGSANFTITGGNLVTLNGNLNASNVSGGNLVSANYFTGTLTTAAQPNITSTGTLAGLVVAGNITPSANITYNLGNNTNRFNDLYLANSTIYIGAQTISANASSVIISGTIVGNISGSATTAGTVTTAAQPNITSTGTLASLSVTANANIGNIGTGGLITATGNLNAGNIITAGIMSSTGNATHGNIITGGVVTATGNITGGNVSGTLLTGTLTTAAQPNVTSVGTLSSLSVTANANIGNIGTGGLITATGNITGGNIITGGVVSATGNITAPNFIGNVVGNISGNLSVAGSNTQVIFNDSGLANANAGFTFNKSTGVVAVTGNVTAGNVSATLLAGTLTTAAQPNITSVGTLTTLGVNGTVTAVAFTANTGVFTGNGSGLSAIAGGNVTGAVSFATTANAVAAANVSGLGNVALLNKDGNGSNVLFGNGVFATLPVGGYGNSNVATFLASYGSNTITTTGNISIGNITTGGLITATGNITGGNITTGGVVTATGNISGANITTAGYHIRSVGTSISAAGSTQGTATALTKEFNQVTTVASGAGVVLPTAVAGMAITIVNTSANSLLVYPASSAAINALSTNVAYTQANANATIQYVALSSTQWYTVGATYA